MAIVQAASDAFKEALLDGTYKIALYGAGAELGPETAAYTATGEVSASGYTAGGASLTVLVGPTSEDKVTYLSFSDAEWEAALSARGAMIYDTTRSNLAVAILDFGAVKTSAATFAVRFPAATAESAILRIRRG